MSIDREFQILICGGGVGGLGAARLLAAAQLSPVIVECQATVGNPVGPVELWPDTMEILSWLGVADAVRETGTVTRSWSLRTADGNVRHRLQAEGAAGLVAVDYGRLRGILRATLPEGSVRTETAVRRLQDDPDTRSVTIEFENGVVEQFDAVIGADGARSTVRDALGGPEPQQYGTTSLAFPLDGPVTVDGVVEQWTANGSILRVLPAGELTWGWITVPTTASDDRAGSREMAEEVLARTDWLSLDTLPERAAGVVVRDDLRVDAGSVVNGRIALAGDAAYARHRLAGVGPTRALEDAAVFAGALIDGDGPLPLRLATYAHRRRALRHETEEPGRPSAPLDGVSSGAPDGTEEAVSVRSARLASSFADTAPVPPIEQPFETP